MPSTCPMVYFSSSEVGHQNTPYICSYPTPSVRFFESIVAHQSRSLPTPALNSYKTTLFALFILYHCGSNNSVLYMHISHSFSHVPKVITKLFKNWLKTLLLLPGMTFQRTWKCQGWPPWVNSNLILKDRKNVSFLTCNSFQIFVNFSHKPYNVFFKLLVSCVICIVLK